MAAADAAAVNRQVDQFRDADTGGIEQVQHGVVSKNQRRCFFRLAEHPVYFCDTQWIRKLTADFRWINIRHRVDT